MVCVPPFMLMLPGPTNNKGGHAITTALESSLCPLTISFGNLVVISQENMSKLLLSQ